MIEFRIKGKVEVYTPDNQLMGSAMLMDFTGRHLYITKPVSRGMVRSLKVHSVVKLVYYGQDKLYGLTTHVTDEIQDNIILYQLPIPEEMETVQRRQHVRIPWTVELKYVSLDAGEESLESDLDREIVEKYYGHRMQTGLSFDLSGMGIGMVVPEKVEKGQRLIVVIEHPKLTLTVIGTVRRVQWNHDQDNYRLGVEFTGIGERKKEKIIRFVFEKMRSQMKMRVKSRGD